MARDEEEYEPAAASAIPCCLARARLALGDDPTALRDLALQSIDRDPYSDQALWVLREVDPSRPADVRLGGIGVQGRDARMEGAGFHVWYVVVADSAYEAFELARWVEETRGFDVLELEDSADRGPRPDLPRGSTSVGHGARTSARRRVVRLDRWEGSARASRQLVEMV